MGRGLGEAWAALRNPAALAAVPVPGGDDGGVDRDDGVGDGHGRGGAGARLQQQRARAAVLPGVLPAGQPAGAELLRQPVAVQLQAHQGARDRRVADLPPRAHVAQHQTPDPPPHPHQATPPTRELHPEVHLPAVQAPNLHNPQISDFPVDDDNHELHTNTDKKRQSHKLTNLGRFHPDHHRRVPTRVHCFWVSMLQKS